MYIAAFSSHLFMTYFYRAGWGAWPNRPPGSATDEYLTISMKSLIIFCQEVRQMAFLNVDKDAFLVCPRACVLTHVCLSHLGLSETGNVGDVVD